MATRQLIVEGLLTSYEDMGSGPVILLLHGWGDSKETFNSLQRSLVDYRTISMDLPGFGKTQAPPYPWSLGDYARFITQFVTKLELASIHMIIGHSNGGAVAIKLLASKSFTIDKLVLIASAGVRDQSSNRKRLFQLGAKIARQPLKVLPKSTQQSVKKRAYSQLGSDLYTAEHMQETFKLIINEDIQQDARSLTVPTLLIYGTNDDATPVKYGRLLQGCIAGSELKVINDAGHFVHHDAAIMVEQYVAEMAS